MALKDWEKARHTGNIWSYFHKSPMYQIWIDQRYYDKQWVFHSEIDSPKVFKSKSQALAYAKKYMMENT